MILEEDNRGEAYKIRKRILFYGVAILFFFVCLSSQDAFFASGPQIPGSGDNQRQLFNQILGRIQNNMSNNPQYFPCDIVDVVDSLGNDGISHSIICPQNTKMKEVHVNIKTQLILWDPNLTINNQQVNVPNFSAGYYLWSDPPYRIEQDIKRYNAINYIMLDPSLTSVYEQTKPGELANEALLYHELLHGQLQINAIKNNATWQQLVCNCRFDLSYADPNHKKIYGLVDTYMDNRAADMNAIAIAVRPVAEADDKGNFKVFIAKAKKQGQEFNYTPVYPNYCNVVTNSIKVDDKDGSFYVTGNLKDQTKAGYFFIYIDPLSVFLFGGIERGVVILPDPPPINDSSRQPPESVHEKQVILLLVILLISGTAVYLKKRSQTS